jgi:tRNA pseudouridine55 synthase
MQTLPIVTLDEEQTVRFCHGQRLPLGLQECERVRVYGSDNQMVGTARINEYGVLAPERLIANK